MSMTKKWRLRNKFIHFLKVYGAAIAFAGSVVIVGGGPSKSPPRGYFGEMSVNRHRMLDTGYWILGCGLRVGITLKQAIKHKNTGHEG